MIPSPAGNADELHRPSRPWGPAPAYPAVPASVVGRKVAGVLAALREQREGSARKQVAEPRKSRKRREGELSLTEFAAYVGLGPRTLRRKLLALGLLQVETEVRDRRDAAPKLLHTARLTVAAGENGMGRRLESRSGLSYDVLTPRGAGVGDCAASPAGRPET